MIQLSISNIDAYSRLMRLEKPIGIYLLLWPTLWAVMLSNYAGNGVGFPDVKILVIFILGVVLMRSAGCVINDYADRNFDGSVERTQHRPMATGEVTEREALQLFALLIGISFLLVLMLNWQTILLSFGALALASLYPFMKRYTHFPQVILGAAFSWAMPMAAMAILQNIPWWIWLVYVANLLWTVAYDTYYAMVDREDDLRVGIKSTAILFGRYDLVIIATLQLITLAMLAYVFTFLGLAMSAFIGLGIAGVLFVKQWHATRHREKPECFNAFLDNHWAGMAIAGGIASSTILGV